MDTPKTIGRYEIIEEIGRGAMGRVYLAHDPMIDRRVAIKTIHALDLLPHAEAEEIRLRFTREAQAAGRLQHTGIVTIFDVGEHEGIYFIAMEYIEGESLDAYTHKESLLPLETAVQLAVQACDALDYAHQQRIVHRDIKPANLMLVKGGRLKITDFGLAKNPHTNLTQDGTLIGTPNYMSPEQVMGKPLDGRSDLFSLAAVLYELLTGQKPFSGDAVTTIIYRILHEQPREPHTIHRRIPPAVGQVLMRALAKEPAQRYQTGGELAQALEGRTAAVAASGARASASGRSPAPRWPAGAPVPKAVEEEPGLPAEPAGVWRARARAVFTLAGTLAAVLLVPGASTLEDRWGRGDADGKPPFYRTAGIVSGTGGATAGPSPAGPSVATPSEAGAPMTPPAVALPGEAGSVMLTLSTSPAGGRIYLDDVEAPGGVIRLSASDTASHTVVAENECFIEKVPFKLDRAKPQATQTIELKTAKVVAISVASSPARARIHLDGRDTGLATPAEVPVTVCGSHRVALKLDGYKDMEVKLDSPAAPLSLSLTRIPEGLVTIASAYPVEVFEKGKKLGAGGGPIQLASGRHTLILKNEELFVERELTVNIQADRTITPEAGLPGVGTLTVLASPSNCSISINGREVGAPPINDYRLAAGTYTIKATYLPTGEAKEATVTVAAGSGARVPFKFNP